MCNLINIMESYNTCKCFNCPQKIEKKIYMQEYNNVNNRWPQSLNTCFYNLNSDATCAGFSLYKKQISGRNSRNFYFIAYYFLMWILCVSHNHCGDVYNAQILKKSYKAELNVFLILYNILFIIFPYLLALLEYIFRPPIEKNE